MYLLYRVPSIDQLTHVSVHSHIYMPAAVLVLHNRNCYVHYEYHNRSLKTWTLFVCSFYFCLSSKLDGIRHAWLSEPRVRQHCFEQSKVISMPLTPMYCFLRLYIVYILFCKNQRNGTTLIRTQKKENNKHDNWNILYHLERSQFQSSFTQMR